MYRIGLRDMAPYIIDMFYPCHGQRGCITQSVVARPNPVLRTVLNPQADVAIILGLSIV